MDSTPTETERLRFWQDGVEHFNARRFWQAHESWEHGWLTLPPREKLHIQVLIQLSGVFDLARRGRPGASISLARRALEKLIRIEELGGIAGLYPRVDIPDLTDVLRLLAEVSEVVLVRKLSEIRLKASLLLSPDDLPCDKSTSRD